MEVIDMQVNMTDNKQDQNREPDFSADNSEYQDNQEMYDEEQDAVEIYDEIPDEDNVPSESSEINQEDLDVNFEHEEEEQEAQHEHEQHEQEEHKQEQEHEQHEQEEHEHEHEHERHEHEHEQEEQHEQHEKHEQQEEEIQIEESYPEDEFKLVPETRSRNEIVENSYLPEKDSESKIHNVPIETTSVQDKDPIEEQLDNTQENAPPEESHDFSVETEAHHCDGEEELLVDDDQGVSAENQEDHEQEAVSASIEAQEQNQEQEISVSDDQESDTITCEDQTDITSEDVDRKDEDENGNVTHEGQISNNNSKKRKAEDLQEDGEKDELEIIPNKRARNYDDNRNDIQSPETHLDESEDVDVTSIDVKTPETNQENEEYIKLTDAQSILEIEYKGVSYSFAGLIETNPDYVGDFRSMEICEMMQEIRSHFGIEQSEEIVLSFPEIELFFTSQTISIEKITIEQLYDYTLSVAVHQNCEIPFRAIVSTRQSFLDQISYLNSLPKVEKSMKELTVDESQENEREDEEIISAGDDTQHEHEQEQDDDQEVSVV